ncbi:HD domain-containing protein [Fervidobacterium riparium]|uniref:HD domain-containing phosphohydrolase n=1 Tax=Fervidobacterium gondwanense TaxID=44754 RepID=UPI003C73BE33
MAKFLKKGSEKIDHELKDFWKILVVDDEPDVHAITSVVARDIVFEGKKVKLYSAYSSQEAKEILENVEDIALAIIDVVMEGDDAGLELVKYIREKIGNKLIRLVIRTGQPGYAPPREIIVKYDINDYREKAELSSNGLYTMIISRLREYRDIVELEIQKRLLERGNFYSSMLFSDGQKSVDDYKMYIESLFDDFSRILNNEAVVKYVESDRNALVDLPDIKFFDNLKHTEVVWKDDRICEFFVSESVGSGKVIKAEFSKQLTETQKNFLTVIVDRFASGITNYLISKDLVETLYKIIYILSEVTETRSLETGEHVRRVGKLSRLFASSLGFGEEYLDVIEIASMLHDVGKIGIPDSILNKPGRLSDEEFEIMKKHVLVGYKILSQVEHPVFEIASNIALYHHENWDGSGYLKGLKGDDIPIEARIVAIVDVYDALMSDRVYRPKWNENDVLEYIKDQEGKKFDPEICKIFFEKYDEIRELYIE